MLIFSGVIDNLYPGKKSIYFDSPGFDMLNRNVKDSALAQFEYDIIILREYISFNAKTNRYILRIEAGNMFGWTKDINSEEASIVFILDPESFVEAGVDPEKIEGWLYIQLETEENGETINAYKFVKTISLE